MQYEGAVDEGDARGAADARSGFLRASHPPDRDRRSARGLIAPEHLVVPGSALCAIIFYGQRGNGKTALLVWLPRARGHARTVVPPCRAERDVPEPGRAVPRRSPGSRAAATAPQRPLDDERIAGDEDAAAHMADEGQGYSPEIYIRASHDAVSCSGTGGPKVPRLKFDAHPDGGRSVLQRVQCHAFVLRIEQGVDLRVCTRLLHTQRLRQRIATFDEFRLLPLTTQPHAPGAKHLEILPMNLLSMRQNRNQQKSNS